MTVKKQFAFLIYLSIFAMACGESAVNGDVTPRPTDTTNAVVPAAQLDTVNHPRLVTAEPDGAYLLTAEKGKAVGPEIKYMPEWRAFGWFTSEDRIEWETEVAKEGDYDVYMEWSVSDEESGKEFMIEAGTQKLTGVVNKSGSWETYKNEKMGSMKLKAGKTTVVLRSKSKFKKGGALMDLRNLKFAFVK